MRRRPTAGERAYPAHRRYRQPSLDRRVRRAPRGGTRARWGGLNPKRRRPEIGPELGLHRYLRAVEEVAHRRDVVARELGVAGHEAVYRELSRRHVRRVQRESVADPEHGIGVDDHVDASGVETGAVVSKRVRHPDFRLRTRQVEKIGAVPIGGEVRAVRDLVEDVAGHERPELLRVSHQVQVSRDHDARVRIHVHHPAGRNRVANERHDRVRLLLARLIVVAAREMRVHHQEIAPEIGRGVEKADEVAARRPQPHQGVTRHRDRIVGVEGEPALARPRRQPRLHQRAGLRGGVGEDFLEVDDVGVDGLHDALELRLQDRIPRPVELYVPRHEPNVAGRELLEIVRRRRGQALVRERVGDERAVVGQPIVQRRVAVFVAQQNADVVLGEEIVHPIGLHVSVDRDLELSRRGRRRHAEVDVAPLQIEGWMV